MLIALTVIGIWLVGSVLVGPFETFGSVIAVVDAFLALTVTGAASRRTHRR